MSKTLYRTYRPKQFSDVIGQTHITQTLQNAIEQNRIGHAYIFTGPRGTGKTTLARLFAISVNTQKRTNFVPVSKDVAQRLQDGSSLDIIEIDAASHTGVDDIRTLKENVGVTPTEAIYKVYIIDEVHMLSTNAFNALLKTLEEPPAHVIFILATTEIHKIPETILSRCQRFDFTRFSVEDIVKKLTLIAKNEDVEIDKEALEMIAYAANGGMRDAESILAQVLSLNSKKITLADVDNILGTTAREEILSMIESIATNDIGLAINTINTISKNGYNIEALIKDLIKKIRILLFLSLQKNNSNVNTKKILEIPQPELDLLVQYTTKLTTSDIIMIIEELTSALQKTKYTTIPQLPLEVAMVNICNKTSNISSKPKTKDAHKTNSNTATTKKLKQSQIDKLWSDSIEKIKKENQTLGSLLSQCTIKQNNDNEIIVITKFSFHQDKILQKTNKKLIETICSDEFNVPITLTVTLKEENDNSSELLDYAKQIMG